MDNRVHPDTQGGEQGGAPGDGNFNSTGVEWKRVEAPSTDAPGLLGVSGGGSKRKSVSLRVSGNGGRKHGEGHKSEDTGSEHSDFGDASMVAKGEGGTAASAVPNVMSGAAVSSPLNVETLTVFHKMENSGNPLLAKLARFIRGNARNLAIKFHRIRDKLAKNTRGQVLMTFKILSFFCLNAALMAYMFVVGRYNERYLGGNLETTFEETVYDVKVATSPSSTLPLWTHDYYTPFGGFVDGSRAAGIVFFPSDGKHSAGWNIRDLLGLDREQDQEQQYNDPVTGLPMVQNLTACRGSCLTENGVPVDLANAAGFFGARNLTATPYGTQPGDYYVDRDRMLRLFDPDYYAAYLYGADTSSASPASAMSTQSLGPVADSSWGRNLPPFFGSWGQSKAFEDNGLERSEPTDQQ